MAWERYDTITYLADQEVLVRNTLEYVENAYEFCRNHSIDNPSAVMSCVIMSAAWVYNNMGFSLSKGIIPDILGIPEYEPNPNQTINMSAKYRDMSHEELLHHVLEAFYEG